MSNTIQTSAITGYDAANENGARSVLLFPTNSRLEYSTWTRRRLLEKSRALEANFGFVTRIRSKFGRAVAGKGIFPFPVTLDTEWNQLAKNLFEQWASNPGLYTIDASRDFWEDQRFSAEQLGAGDGEVFRLKVRKPFPTLQPLDPFEVGGLWGTFPANIDPIYYDDGVRTDAYFRPVSYMVTELPGPPQWGAPMPWREVAAGDMVHVFRRRRDKQLRGLPPLYSVLNDGNDVLDLLALEKATDKLHALLAVSKTRKPEKGGDQGVGGQIKKILGQDGRTDRLAESFKGGAVTVSLDEGEELDLLTSSRPGQPMLDGITFYCRMTALGADLPLSVVFTFAELGGTPTRAELEDAQNTFDLQQDLVVSRHSQPIYTWRIANAMESGELRRCRDPYWWANDWHGPAKITTDYGRTAAANIDLMRSGLYSAPRYHEERGQDAYAEMRKHIDWLKAAQDYCEKMGVDFSRFFEPTPGATPKAPGDNNSAVGGA